MKYFWILFFILLALAIGIRIIKWKIKCRMMAKEFERREKRKKN